ncbi:MAG TPA: VOC family protein, partial [Phycisphaerales bacterium]|nr:VOC family protein [Phycisphaerales bacterium]
LLRDTGLSGGLSDKRIVVIAETGNEPAGEGTIVRKELMNKRGFFAALVAAIAGSGAAQAEQAAQYYTSIFPNSSNVKITHYGPDMQPPMQEGDINTVFEESRSEWGSLPERVRDMLLQGRRERFSSLYEQLTREYYRRLAED